MSFQFGKAQTVEHVTNGKFIDTTKPKVYLTQGMRGGGKSVFDENLAEKHYSAGWTILDLLGARNLENLYWCVNKNHRAEYLEGVRKGEIAKGTMHCNCSTRYPISVLVPSYVKFDQDTIDTYNQKYWTKEEWIIESAKRKSRLGGKVEWSSGFPVSIANKDGTFTTKKSDTKPPIRNQFELVKIKHLTPPTVTGSNKDIITDEFYKVVFEARRQRRIVCFNPMLFPNEFHRYKTLEIIIRSLENLSYRHFTPPTPVTVGKIRGLDIPVPIEGIPSMRIKKWTERERNWDKILVLMREFGEVTANILKGENQSTLTKKALLQYIRQTRHYRISLVGDFQRPDDVFPSIREQADYFIIKRASQKLLGDGWKWLFEDIDKKRNKIFEKFGLNPVTLNYADKKYPQVNQLAKNHCYVIYTDNTFKLFKTNTPNFHHKGELEHFENDTGIKWIEEPYNARLAKAGAKSEEIATAQFEKNDWEDKIFNLIVSEIGSDQPKWDTIFSKMVQLKTSKVVEFPETWGGKDAVRKWFGRKKLKKEKTK